MSDLKLVERLRRNGTSHLTNARLGALMVEAADELDRFQVMVAHLNRRIDELVTRGDAKS